MPYIDTDDGHRMALTEDVIPYARGIFELGFQLEAILLAHEYLEQRLNAVYKHIASSPASSYTIHRKFKQLIDLFISEHLLAYEDYDVLNEFNRLRNVNSNQVLDFSLTLRGAKKGDMIKAINLAEDSERIISTLSQELAEVNKGKKKKSRKRDGGARKNGRQLQ